MPPISKPKFTLAVSLVDLDRVDPIIRAKLFKDRQNLDNLVQVEDDIAAAFTCPLLDACRICDYLRSEDRKNGDTPTRIYLRSGEGEWKKTDNNAVFCAIIEGVTHLNPIMFDQPVKSLPLPAKRISFEE